MTASALSLQAVEVSQCISSEPLDLAGLLAKSHHPLAGAVVLFSGDVRDNNLGNHVDYLEYEAKESMAAKMIQEILLEAKERWNLNIAVAQHRIGKVAVGECAVVVITATPHRREAYEANRHIIDRIKHEVPIWKCEYFKDGSKKWGGNCNCHDITGDPNKHLYETSTSGSDLPAPMKEEFTGSITRRV
ncbi:molybdenum cofactor biosynthesis protein MoaE [Desertivirga arenae]|uniref:molybdenum cofactor biosynthesis protein MoaE n=1 Tax=Desertivirga arenae TaxID=2810309 RepID=UPI001A974EFD|nr:molybdenum cofactor biosynthesis protein MoaE [Pedobacter sp. SYSU D00823]